MVVTNQASVRRVTDALEARLDRALARSSGDELLCGWVSALRWRGLAPRTVYQFMTVVNMVGTDLAEGGTGPASEWVLAADAADIETWIATRRLAPTTVGNYICALASFYRWANASGHCNNIPTDALDRPRRSRHLPRPMSTDLLQSAIRCACPEVRLMIVLGAYGGLRASEIAALHVHDIDINRGWLTVNADGAKGSVERKVPLHRAVTAALADYDPPDSGPVFPGPDGNCRRPTEISALVSGLLRGLGCTSRRKLHALRHWYATAVYDASDGDLLLTQRLLGHASPTTTAIYAAPSKDAIDVISRI